MIGHKSFSLKHLPLRKLERPQGDVVHLWHLDFDQLSTPLNSEPNTRPGELSVFQQTATRRFYLRLLLGAYLDLPGKDIRIIRRIKGKPELDSAQSRGTLDFNMARSDNRYLIGISSGAIIGVDLEVLARRSRNPMALATRYFSAAETAALSKLGEDDLQRAFMHTWACKESIVKASGMGIANQLCRFTVDVNPDNPPAVLDMQDDDHTSWKLAIAEPAHGSIAAIAVRQDSVSLLGFNLS